MNSNVLHKHNFLYLYIKLVLYEINKVYNKRDKIYKTKKKCVFVKRKLNNVGSFSSPLDHCRLIIYYYCGRFPRISDCITHTKAQAYNTK